MKANSYEGIIKTQSVKELTVIAKSGRPTKYDVDKHLELLFTLFREGKTPSKFCDIAAISRCTFYLWLKTHKEFKDGYDIAVCMAAAWWEEYPEINPDFNYPRWSNIMKNRFGEGKIRLSPPKDNTPLARMDTIWKSYEAGELSPQEASSLTSTVNTHNNIVNGIPDSQSEFKLDSREEIMAKVCAIQEVLDHKKKVAKKKVTI